MLLSCALLPSLVSASAGLKAAPDPEPAAQAQPLGGCVPGTEAVARGPLAKEAARPTKAWVTPGTGVTSRVERDGAEVTLAPEAVDRPTEVGVQPLTDSTLPGLGSGMDNMTKGPRGYRFTPTPHTFQADLTVSLPYDPAALKASGYTPADVRTFYFDEATDCWQPLERIEVDEERHLVVSRTDHFTDMVNAVVTAPESPEQVGFDPNRIQGIRAADPSAGVNQIAAPGANGQGDARLAYPLELPGGRAALAPSLAVTYSSASSEGWLGTGWDLTVPSISVDTRWGVPRYDAARETETYLLNGEQLTPVAHRSTPGPRTADKVFHKRVEGDFARIVRTGDSPGSYGWEVTDRAGVRYVYGGEGATLADDRGNTFSWALREVRDPHGNTVRYTYATVRDAGVADGTVEGRNLYMKRIAYTGRGDSDGPYTVTFVRDRELAEPRRTDVAIDARGGFKRVTADLLRRVEVRFEDKAVRSYELAYTTGAFHKTLLKSIEQFDADGTSFNRHDFGYFDDIRDATGAYQAFAKVDWATPDDDVRDRFVDGVRSGAGEAGALNGNGSTGAGGHLYVGYGFSGTKSGSIGIKAGYNRNSAEGLLALADVDGDNLPDKVFKDGDGYAFRKNLSRPGGTPSFAATTTPLRGLPGILSESSSTRTVGIEGYLSGIAAQLNHVDTRSTTRRYFSDVNADGVVDLVDGPNVLFGRVGTDGAVAYGAAADTPVPIGSGTVDTDGLLPDHTAERERRDASFPLVDTVRRWTAPYDGTVRVSGGVALKAPATADEGSPDGVRVAIQHEDAELWTARIPAGDHDARTPQGVDEITVERGQHLYFRVGSVSDGTADQVAWDPVVTYTGDEATDANGLSLRTYTASGDFTLAGRSATVEVPEDGTLRLSGDVRVTTALSDDVTVLVTRDGEPVLEKRIPAGESGTVSVNADVPVTKGQDLAWRIAADSPVDATALAWSPRAAYTSTPTPSGPAATDERFGAEFHPPYDIATYEVTGASAPQRAYPAPGGTFTVTPRIAVPDGTTGQAVLTVKKRGALLAKRTIRLGEADATPLEVTAAAGEALYYDVTFTDAAVAAKVTGAHVTLAGESLPATVHAPAAEGVFARTHRGWSVVGYNAHKEKAARPVDQAALAVDVEDLAEQLPKAVDPAKDRDAFAADPKVTPPNVVPFTPDGEHGRWSAGEFLWVAADTASSSRFGGPTLGLPDPAQLASAHAVPRVSRNEQISLTGSIGGDVGSAGGSVATGTSHAELDYLDMNADGFPDVVGANGIQYTDPTGTLGATRGAVPGGAVRTTDTKTGNASAGSAARTITTGRGHADPSAAGSANTSSSGNDMPPLGIGGNLGTSASDTESDLLDINGDGLPDRVYEDGRAALNLGYRFAAPEPWPGGRLNEGSGTSSGLSLGFNTDFYGFGGGASFEQDASRTKGSLADVNGDGLTDRVLAGSPIRVALNTGNGFAPYVPFHGSLSGLSADSHATLGGGAYFRISFGTPVTGYLVINPGFNVSKGTSRSEQTLRDLDGDGLADHLASTKDDELTVAANRTGRTNLLKSVARPLGSRIDLDYTRDGNTYDQPGSRWLLTKSTVHDNLPGDGPDAQEVSFTYEGGVFDRREREFRGYAKVATSQAGTRTSTTEYETGSHYTNGLVKRQTVADSTGALFTETVNTHALRDVTTGTAGDARSLHATLFPHVVKSETRWYEGAAAPGMSTAVEQSYDDFGNVTRTLDHGEPGTTADDVEALTEYSACPDSHIVGTAVAIRVRGGGKPMRSRSADVDCATGDVTRTTAKLADGTESVTDLTYFETGALRSVTAPRNHRGQRYERAYTYDAPTGTYVTSTTDSFGYASSASYDLRFGAETESTDINGQKVRTTYDSVGRVDTVTGPHDHGAGRPTIAFAYHPEAEVPYALTRHLDRTSDGSVEDDTIDTVTFADGLGRVVQTKKDAAVDGQDVMTVSGRTVFDALGRVAKQHYPVTEPKGAENTTFRTTFDTVRPTTFTYDVLDRPLRTNLPDGTVSRLTYGFGEDRTGETRFETVATDAKGNETHAYADARQQKTAVREPGAKTGEASIWTSYAYDPLGQLTKVEDDKRNTTTTGYDDLGRRTVVDSPDAGRTTTAYDPAGNVTQVITANLAAQDKAVTYTYDFNRLERISYPVFTENDVRYTYGAPGAAGNAAGRLTKVEDAAGEVTRSYGPLGEVTQETRILPAPGPRTRAFTTAYRHDSFGRVLSLTYPDGEQLAYTYDSGGEVTAAAGTKNGFTYPYLRTLTYDKFGQRSRIELGNGTTTTFTHDAEDRRLATQQAKLPTGYAFQNLSYTYDEVGNLTRQENATELPTGADAPKLGGPTVRTYAYDNLYRLTEAGGSYRFAHNKTDTYAMSMAYDTIHNITTKAQSHGITVGSNNTQPQRDTTYTHGYTYTPGRPHAPTRIGGESLTYDANGNLTDNVSDAPGNPRRQQIWDEDNRLACVHDTSRNQTQPQAPSACTTPGKPPTVRFLYDADGSRVVKDGAQTTLYPNQNYSARNETEFKHVFVGTTRIATKTSKPGNAYEKDQFYYHGDHLGSTTYGTDGTGRLAEHLDYFPSGEVWIDEKPGEKNPYQFTGKELDEETGYTYHGARYYDPRSGVWQSPDPALGDYLNGETNSGVYSPVNLALYAYGRNNPGNYTDPTGASWVRGTANQVGGVFVGFGQAAWEAGSGAVSGAWSAAKAGYNCAGDVGACATAVRDTASSVGTAVWNDPVGVAKAVGAAAWDEATGEIRNEWSQGNYGKAIGRGAFGAVEAVFGAKGLNKIAKVGLPPCKNSFTPGTEVVMADGSGKPIEELEPGDLVLATDPETNTTEAKPVTALISGEGEKHLVKITVDTDGPAGERTAAVTATDNHPFWIESLRGWLDAEDLRPGMGLRTDKGASVAVVAVEERTAPRQRVHNVTVADLHTYYVLTGGTPVLVHNCGGAVPQHPSTCNCANGGIPQVRNGKLAGGVHPVTGVPFDTQGFPDFSAWRHPQVADVRIQLTGDRKKDFALANKASGLRGTPEGWTWHHHQDSGLMQLVDRDIHAETGHTGGF
ncbi:SpvB/TcaC N-terminal domain-containing protein [Streptomyces sp. NPDC047974]|uniref:SpvB/TcaC N-terminal domain-containing protein n=1 Tax=Streptomyces sp. NPDC047974 TaxID=3154343 RepID=UPI0033D2DA76